MRYRALSASGDRTFGQGAANFLVDSPECVAQRVLTRLRLLRGEWFLDVTAGTPYDTQVLGYNTKQLYDRAIQQVILDTPGVLSLDEYQSTFDGSSRALSITATITSQFGPADIQVVLP